jgi:predicted dehydrogenase
MAALRVALIGYGLAGRVFDGPLLRATPGLIVAGIIVRDRGCRAQAALDSPQARLLASANDVWARREEFDLVVVATPPDLHTQVSLWPSAVKQLLPTESAFGLPGNNTAIDPAVRR